MSLVGTLLSTKGFRFYFTVWRRRCICSFHINLRRQLPYTRWQR